MLRPSQEGEDDEDDQEEGKGENEEQVPGMLGNVSGEDQQEQTVAQLQGSGFQSIEEIDRWAAGVGENTREPLSEEYLRDSDLSEEGPDEEVPPPKKLRRSNRRRH